jgi:hypothetical protein
MGRSGSGALPRAIRRGASMQVGSPMDGTQQRFYPCQLGRIRGLTQIPKFGNRSRPYSRARPRCIGVLCRQRPHLSCNYFVPLARL